MTAASSTRLPVLVAVTIAMLTVGMGPAVASYPAPLDGSSIPASDPGLESNAPNEATMTDALPTLPLAQAGSGQINPASLAGGLDGLADEEDANLRAFSAARQLLDQRPFSGLEAPSHANLELAEALMEAVPAHHGPGEAASLRETVAIVEAIEDPANRPLGPTAALADLEPSAGIEQALDDLIDASRLEAYDPQTVDEQGALLVQQTPFEIQEILADLLTATADLLRVSDANDWKAHTPLDGGPTDVLTARQEVLSVIADLDEVVGEASLAEGPTEPVRLPPLLAVDTSTGDSVYEEDYLLQVDLGGDDVYRNNAGGSGVDAARCPDAIAQGPRFAPPVPSAGSRAAVLVDLEGDDEYGDASDPRSCGANGGAWHGVGVLVDAQGNDTYVAAGYGANGGAVAGLGLLVDAGGDDVYRAGSLGTNGGGADGGTGVLVDAAGEDRYDAGSRGANGGASQNSLGLLVDVAGLDEYAAERLGTNGGGHQVESGTMESSGRLIDLAGADAYQARAGGVNGGGLNGGVGFLFDAAGEDRYEGGVRGANGGGAEGGEGVLVDVLGDDVYEGASPAFLRGEQELTLGPVPGDGSTAVVQAASDATTADRYVVGLEPKALPVEGGSFLGAPVERVHEGLAQIVLAPDDPERFLHAALQDEDVRWMEPDRTYSIAEEGFPDDELFEQQYGPQHTNITEAWQLAGTGDGSAKVCIVDTGIRDTHEDIQGSLTNGTNVIAPDTPPMDDDGHGTHVAGTVAAGIHNGVGIAGMASVGLHVVKVFEDGQAEASDAAAGIHDCIEAGVDVINLSFRGPHSRAIEEAIQEAWSEDILLVAAAGNSHCRLDCTIYPASYPEVVAVACTDAHREPCTFNSHSIEVEVSAPGSSILSLSADADDAYMELSGTSMASPHVAGAAALIRGHAPQLSNEDVRELLRFHAHDVFEPGCDEATGYGVIDANKSLAGALAGEIPSTGDERGCAYANGGVNGGGFEGGLGLLVDADGDDAYRAGHNATNGGSVGGIGALIDLQGDDAYEATTHGPNGAGEEGRFRAGIASGSAFARPSLPGGGAFLFDGEGTDTYEDEERGNRQDASQAPNGLVGIQLDSDDPDVDLEALPGAPSLLDPDSVSVFAGVVTLEDSHLTLDDTLVVAPGAHLELRNVTIKVRDTGDREGAGDPGPGLLVAPGGTFTAIDSSLTSHPEGQPGWIFEVRGAVELDGTTLAQARQLLVEGPTAEGIVQGSHIEANTLNGLEVATRGQATVLDSMFVANGHEEADISSGGLRATSTLTAQGNVLIGNANRGIQVINPAANLLEVPAPITIEDNVFAYQDGVRALHMQDFYRTVHTVHGNLFTGNCVGLSLQSTNDVGVVPEEAFGPIFAKNTIVDNRVAGANFGFSGATGALGEVVDDTVSLVDTWLGPGEPTWDPQDRNNLQGPWDVSRLADEDPNPHLWDRLDEAEQVTGITEGPCSG